MCEKDRDHCCNGPFGPHEHRCEGGENREHCEQERRGRLRQFYNEASVNDKLDMNLRFIGHTMRSRFEANAGQKRILIILSESEKLTQKELTERLGIRPGSASEILSKLETAGLIERTPNEDDRRTVDISLTEAGAERAKESAEKRQKWNEDMFTCLTAEEQETLLSLLEKLHADWEERFPGHYGPHGHHGPFGPHGPHGHHGPFGHYCHHGHHGPHGECCHKWEKPDFYRPDEQQKDVE